VGFWHILAVFPRAYFSSSQLIPRFSGKLLNTNGMDDQLKTLPKYDVVDAWSPLERTWPRIADVDGWEMDGHFFQILSLMGQIQLPCGKLT
jgi:hypothetical protein